MSNYEIKKTALIAKIIALRRSIAPNEDHFNTDCSVDSYFYATILAELTECKALRELYEANPEEYLATVCMKMMKGTPQYLQCGILNELIYYVSGRHSLETIIDEGLEEYDEEQKKEEEKKKKEEEEQKKADEEDKWCEIHQTMNKTAFLEVTGNTEALQFLKTGGMTYYNSWGGGPEGGYVLHTLGNETKCYEINRTWGTQFTCERVEGSLAFRHINGVPELMRIPA